MKRNHFTPYSVLDELMASDSQPLPAEKRTHQLMRMRQGLDDLMHAAMPGADSWRVLSDAVNLLETLVLEGEAPQRDGAGRIVGSHCAAATVRQSRCATAAACCWTPSPPWRMRVTGLCRASPCAWMALA